MFVAHRLPANHLAFPGFSLVPLLVSAATTTANDRSKSTTGMRSTSDSSIFVTSQFVVQAPFLLRLQENGSSSPSYCCYEL